MENLIARRLRTVLANEIEDGMEHNLSHQLGEDKPLYLSPRQGSPTMDDLASCAEHGADKSAMGAKELKRAP